MKFLYRNRGAVSVFLVIILLPMLLVSSMFVDASRVKLSRSVLDSAADLTLNTALTDYDTMLKDMYGLFATAQDTEELYERLEKYYTTCITSSGVSDEEAEGYVDQLMAQLGLVADGADTSDLLGIQVTDFDISKRTDASLANAAVLEKQIVEFMKYRAPINTGLSFLSSLKSFKTLGKQTELVDKRKEYYEGQQNVMENAQLAWKEIYEYNKCGFANQDDYLTKMKEDFEQNFDDLYHEYSIKTIKDLYDAQDYDGFDPRLYSIVNEDYTFVFYHNGEEVRDKAKGMPIMYLNHDKNQRHEIFRESLKYTLDHPATLSDVQDILENLNNLKEKISDEIVELIYYDDASYNLQVLVQSNRLKQYETLTDDFKEMYRYYFLLRNAEKTCGTEVMATRVTMFGDSSPKELGQYANSLQIDSEVLWKNELKNTIERLNTDYQHFRDEIVHANATDTTEVNEGLNQIHNAAASYRQNVEDGITHLEAAKGYLKSIYDAVKPDGNLDQLKNSWQDVANDSELVNTPLASQDKAEIESLSTYLNAEDVQKLITRIENIINNLQTLREQIDSVKYFGVFPQEINGYVDLEKILENNIGADKLKSVPINAVELNSQAEAWVQGKYIVGAPLDISWENQQGTEPNLTKGEKLNFYSYLYGHFGASGSGEMPDTKNAEDEYSDIKKNNTAKADAELSKSGISKEEPKEVETGNNDGGKESEKNKNTDDGPKELINMKNRPSADPNLSKDGAGSSKIDTSQNAAKNSSTSISNMLGDLGAAIARMGTDLRDKLYVSDYILSMLSYDTIEKEFKNKNPDVAKEAKPVSLTLTPIDAEHNYAYLNEVEYIIYGGKNASNSFKAYGSIYGIRLAFNLIYAFMDSSIRDGAFAIATPISAATLGVIPVPLIQAAIIIGLACLESSLDIAQLKLGEKVPLFKDGNTWRCSVKGGFKKAEEVVVNAAGELLDYTSDKLSEMIDEGGDKIKDYATGAFDDLITRNANIAIQKMTTLTSNAFEEFNRTQTDMVEYVNNGLDEWIENEGAASGGNIAFTIKKEAVKIIKEQFVQRFVDAFKSCQGKVNGDLEKMGDSINSVLEEIRTKISNSIVDASDEIKRYKDEMMSELKDSMKQGAEKVSETLSNRLDGTFGSGSDADDNTGMASLIQFYYSDYLRLFLMIGLYVNEEAIILRTADAIQANMSMASKDSNYMLSKSSAYVEMSATVQVQPMLLALPLFADVEDNPKDSRGWYTLESSGIKGY